MGERDNYMVAWHECCYTCQMNDRVEGALICTLVHEPTHPLGICDAYEEGELNDTI
jgi:hypothetical protein